jgi:hypothetical protein
MMMRVAKLMRSVETALVVVLMLAASPHAQGQQPARQPPPTVTAPWTVTPDARIPPAGEPKPEAPRLPGLKGPQIESKVPPPAAAPAPANTTVIQRPAPESRTSAQITLVAQLTDESQPLEQGVVWRVFRDKPGADGKMRLLSTHRDPQPSVRLDAGDYLVNAALGRANLTRRISVAPGKAALEKFVLNAGGLKLVATLSGGEAPPDNTVSYDIQSDERDQLGNRTTIVTNARPGVVVRLNAGIFHVISTYGDANATVRADVTVEPGKITEATVSHMAAKATFRLVMHAGSEALADTQWSIVNLQGETVKESVGALPSHILAAGTYTVNARRAGQTYRQDFTVKAGETAEIEVVMR